MPNHPRWAVLRRLVVLLLILTANLPARPVLAISGSDPMAIISAVNALRAAQGLPPYVVDQGLMAFALEHSRYQASLHTPTHTHSDGSTVWQQGMDENIAVGMLGYLTPEYAVYTIWSDAIHMKTMISYPSGTVGAGVADDGADEYYTLDVRPGGSPLPTARAKGTVDPKATPTKIIPIVPLLTVTPRNDRWIIHTVGYGQSLWSVAIAYGVKMDQIRAWNSMAADNIEIYAGQKLYIIAPAAIWPTLTASPTGGVAGSGLTVTPGWSITEEPRAATEKAAYQLAVAATQIPAPGVTAAQRPAATPSRTPTEQPAASVGSTPGNQRVAAAKKQPAATFASQTQLPAPDNLAALNDTEQADPMPLVAGILILFGGGLLVVIAFSMLRRR